MMIRRTFLKSSTLALVAAGAGPVALFSGRSARGADSGFNRARFDALVNHWFVVGDAPHPTLELVRVEDGPHSPGFEQFTAIFRGHRDETLGEATLELRPEGQEPMLLHLAPLEGDADGTYFAAMFNVDAPPPPPPPPSCA